MSTHHPSDGSAPVRYALPDRERRKAELMSMINEQRPKPAPKKLFTNRFLIPALAAASVAACVGVGVAVQGGTGESGPAASGPAGLPGGQTPSEGVPREQAKPGDPVPWDVANQVFDKCMADVRAGRPPGRTFMSAVEVVSGTGTTSDPYVANNWYGPGLPEPVDLYRPYFTAWKPMPDGTLRPLVVGKATGPGLARCLDEGSRTPSGVSLVFTRDRIDLIDSDSEGTGAQSFDPQAGYFAYGRASADVAKITAEFPDGGVADAEMRNGMWFIYRSAPQTQMNPSFGFGADKYRATDSQGKEQVIEPFGLRRNPAAGQ
jgi:hypothetical protein